MRSCSTPASRGPGHSGLRDNARVTVLFGHPTGNPNSHHAALAHFEAGWLEAFCVPWMPTELEIGILQGIPGLDDRVARLRRRCFAPLAGARIVQGRFGEWGRLLKRLVGGAWADERLSYQANDWLMRTMARECRRGAVTAVHAYEDCSLQQFETAARLGKRRIYDLPGGCYPAWEAIYPALAKQYADWLPPAASLESAYVRPGEKRREMALADLIMVPTSFAQHAVRQYSDRQVAVVPYGVDADFWSPGAAPRGNGPMRFLYAGQCSVRKGTPLLLQAWKAAALEDATLELVGAWQLSAQARGGLPDGVIVRAPASAQQLRDCYRAADLFVFPSHFEGFGLVILEAMACGLAVIASDATAGPDVLTENTGRVTRANDLDALVESLRWANAARDRVASMGRVARSHALGMTWAQYRGKLRAAVAPIMAGA